MQKLHEPSFRGAPFLIPVQQQLIGGIRKLLQLTTGGKLIIQRQNRIGLIIGIMKLRGILILQQQMIIGGKILQHESQGQMCGILILRNILILLQLQEIGGILLQHQNLQLIGGIMKHRAILVPQLQEIEDILHHQNQLVLIGGIMKPHGILILQLPEIGDTVPRTDHTPPHADVPQPCTDHSPHATVTKHPGSLGPPGISMS